MPHIDLLIYCALVPHTHISTFLSMTYCGGVIEVWHGPAPHIDLIIYCAPALHTCICTFLFITYCGSVMVV